MPFYNSFKPNRVMDAKPVDLLPPKEEKLEKKPEPPPTKKSDAACLQIIKKMNGFKDNVWKEIDKIEIVELVLEDFGTMLCVNRFKGVKSLTLINVGISSIEGLSEATRLEEMWLNENTIGKLEGLEKCTALRSLYISHNLIRKIEGLDTLGRLETLWLCDNKIEVLENLEKLQSIKQLWIAGNQIEYIKTSLDSLTNLVDLNLSGNKIRSFKEALNLNRLPNLKILSFYDPHFGENPICNLCNYQTYVLYHLRNISKLDTLAISEDAKAFSESTYMRKKMYYNMRIKTMQRSFSTLEKLVKKASNIKVDGLNEDLINLNIKIGELGEQAKELQQLKEVHSCKMEEMDHVRTVFESVQKRLFETDSTCIHKLITELETGGNIRLEEGKPTEKWFVSCAELIKSRFDANDFAPLGIVDINIKRVIRIHNKFLKNKFEEKMEALVDVSNTSTRKLIEYLFYGQDPNAPGQMEHVIEEGFRTPAEAKKLGLCPYTPLANTLQSADLPRLTSYLKSKKNEEKFGRTFIKKRNLGEVVTYPTGSMLICKVLVLKHSLDPNHPYYNPSQSPIEALQTQPVQVRDTGEYAVYRVKDNESRDKLWFYLDNNIVQPEYIVEFDYVVQSKFQNNVSDFGDCVALLESNSDQFISPKNIATYLKDINEIYNRLVEEVSNYQFENIEQDSHPNLEIQAIDLDRMDIGSIKVMLANYFKYCFSRSEAFYELNPNALLQPSEDFDFRKLKIENAGELRYANLSNLKIRDLSFLRQLGNLDTLVLSNNAITKLTDLEACPLLKSLDLSHNEISQLHGLAALKQLNYLDLSHNEITSMDSLRLLQLNINLREINLLFNPFSTSEGLELFLYKTVKSLKCINHKELSQLQLEESEKPLMEITEEMIKENTKILQTKGLQEHNWKLSIENLSVTHCRLASMRGLETLVNLRQLNLSHNLLTQIDYIQHCKLTEELNLEENRITRIEKLGELIYLKKLELGKNRIARIQGIQTLQNLLQLSLEDNQLTTLEDFPQLKSLLELYLGNNKLADTKEINRIKDLQKLIILDMSGNPLSRDNSYRIYTLYVLKKLKVLDGNTIEGFEQQQAREHFTGRLTEEILREKLDGRRAEDITELDLSNCRLKDFEEMFNHRVFPHLSELVLSGNEFTSVKMLGYLPCLKILILQANRIESLYYNTDPGIQKGLNGCQNLDIIDLGKNCLKDFNGLQFCKLGELKILKAYQNEITKIDNLDNLKQLKELDVNHNKIKQFDVNSFEARNPIKCLKIDDNGLKNFNNIQKLVRLQHLFANSNRINEFHDVDRLCQLVYLKELELNGNSLYRKPGYRSTMIKKLPNLAYLDSKEITPEERMDQQGMTPTNGPNGPGLGPNQAPAYIPQLNNQRQVPVRLSSVNFEGVFTNNKLDMQSLLSQNLYSRDPPGPPPPRK